MRLRDFQKSRFNRLHLFSKPLRQSRNISLPLIQTSLVGGTPKSCRIKFGTSSKIKPNPHK
jgi:hypothetical protein